MSDQSNPSSAASISTLLGAAREWHQKHVMSLWIYGIVSGVIAALIQLWGNVLLPFGIGKWFVYVQFFLVNSLIHGFVFWFLLFFLLLAYVGVIREAGFGAIANGLAKVPERLGASFREMRSNPVGSLLLGLACGFAFISLFKPAPTGSFITNNSVIQFNVTTSSFVLILLLMLSVGFSGLNAFVAGSIAKRRKKSSSSVAPSSVTAFCLAFALVIFINLPIGTSSMNTRIAILVAALGVFVWLSQRSPSVPAAANLIVWLPLLSLLVDPPAAFAQNSIWANWNMDTISAQLTTETKISAAVVFIFAFLGGRAGASLGHAFGQQISEAKVEPSANEGPATDSNTPSSPSDDTP